MATRLFVCVGKKVVGSGLADLIGARPIASVPLRWGDQTIDRYQAADGRVVVAVDVGPGTAPVTNPFLTANPAGTFIRRGQDKFEYDTVNIAASWRY